MTATAAALGDWHILTCEYPPQVGGVSDYTFALASGLADSGHRVHVWCPAAEGQPPDAPGVVVHREWSGFTARDLRRVGGQLNAFERRRLFVQWVPHGFGYRSLNLGFALWLAWRAWILGDEMHVMVHEPFLRFSRRPRQAAAALVHRVMLALACSGAVRVWLSIPTWVDDVRPYVPRRTPVRWLPVPAPTLRDATLEETEDVRRRFASPRRPMVGHFGTFSPLITRLLEPAIDVLLQRSNASVLLVGRGGDMFRDSFVDSRPEAVSRVHATGVVERDALCRHLQACDLMIQPYPDGISARRTSALALMAHGVPIVTNHGRLTETFWREANAVTLIAEPDGRRVGEAAVEILHDLPQRERLARAARDLYDRMFDVRHAVAAVEAAS